MQLSEHRDTTRKLNQENTCNCSDGVLDACCQQHQQRQMGARNNTDNRDRRRSTCKDWCLLFWPDSSGEGTDAVKEMHVYAYMCT